MPPVQRALGGSIRPLIGMSGRCDRPRTVACAVRVHGEQPIADRSQAVTISGPSRGEHGSHLSTPGASVRTLTGMRRQALYRFALVVLAVLLGVTTRRNDRALRTCRAPVAS